MPKISVVLPTYNGERFIRKSIESVISQTETDWELIIVNDCSTDATLDICREYEAVDARIKVISNEVNRKLPASLNVGFRAAAGEHLTWTSDDNMYKPDALRVMSDFLASNKAYDLVCCEYDIVNESGVKIREFRHINGREKEYYLLSECNVGACFMYTRPLFERVGDYNENFFCAEDYEYWMRIALSGRIKYLKGNHYTYVSNEYSLTATKQNVVIAKTKEIRSKYLPIFVKHFSISNKEMAHIYYMMWRYDSDNVDLIWSAANLDRRYLYRAGAHRFKMFRRKVKNAIKKSARAVFQ